MTVFPLERLFFVVVGLSTRYPVVVFYQDILFIITFSMLRRLI